jgi:hypothetical protein
MKISPTQRLILGEAVQDDDPHYYFENCVYERNRRGLERAGAIAQDSAGQWYITDEAHEAMTS